MDKPTLTFGSLFSGIGGLDLGLERAGMQCAWQVEIDDYATKVLAKHWPDVARHGDVRYVGKHNLSRVDLIAGGFPCQPHSQAGERKASQDERDLWPEFYRIIRELKPRWVVAENVLGLLSSEDGVFFGGILRDLAKAGYDARWQVLSAAEFGAPHLRERVIVVAHRHGRQCEELAQLQTGWEQVSRGRHIWEDADRRCEELANASRQGLPECGVACGIQQATNSGTPTSPERRGGAWANWDTRPTESCLGELLDGISTGLVRHRWPAGPGQPQHEWEPPRVVSEKVPNRTKMLKGLGNAVVPALAEYVGHCIMAIEAERQAVA